MQACVYVPYLCAVYMCVRVYVCVNGHQRKYVVTWQV
jgi:hypothetical protein